MLNLGESSSLSCELGRRALLFARSLNRGDIPYQGRDYFCM